MICLRCVTEKDQNLFYKNKARSTGYDQYCKKCRLEYTAKWAKTITGFSCRKKARRAFYLNNKDYELAKSRQWRGGKKNGTPPWLSKEQLEQIEYVYALARDCRVTTGEPYEVDHIVPIRGDNVCGLHVPWNLQILPKDLNASKGNR